MCLCLRSHILNIPFQDIRSKMISLDQKDTRKRRFLPGMIKRLGCGQFSLGKLLEDVDIAKERHYPWKLEKRSLGIKQINVKCNKQGEENKEKRNRAN